jgi:PucR-like helix-turn-helix protein/diguanylate cyclase with GGDEF domain
MQHAVQQARTELARRLRRRQEEIEHEALTRVQAISDPVEVADPVYAEGLRRAVTLAIQLAIESLEAGEGSLADAPPPGLLEQARLAAQNGIGLDTVLRRYLAGYTLFGEFAMREATADLVPKGVSLHVLTQPYSSQFDRLLAGVSEEYTRQREAWVRSSARRQAERVQRLLSGELVDTTRLDYEFGCWHLGLLADGDGAEETVRRLARDLDCRLLLVPAGEVAVWAWLGSRERPDHEHVLRRAAVRLPLGAALAVGEPAHGLAGWRLSHRQAKAAMPLAMRRLGRAVRYADVALLATLLTDELLATSLRQMFLVPLGAGGDDARSLVETLRAYISAQGNVSSAAAALGVSRHTVTNRLRASEGLLERPLGTCVAELDAALRLSELSDEPAPLKTPALDERAKAAAANWSN